MICAVFLALSVSTIPFKSLTADEACHHIASGYIFLDKGDYAFSTEAPPLGRYIVAEPLLFMNIKLPAERAFWAREDRGEFSREFLYSLNRQKLADITFYSRLMNIFVGLFGGIFLFLWTEKRYGTTVSAVASFFYFLSPEIIAHSSLATTDIAAAVFIMCSALTFWDFLEKPSMRSSTIAAGFLGLGLLTKFSALLLCPLYLVIVLGAAVYGFFAGREKDASRLARLSVLMGFMAFFVVWMGYGFETKPLLKGVLRAGEKQAFFENAVKQAIPHADMSMIKKIGDTLYTVPVPLSSYIMGTVGIMKHGEEGSSVFFMGKWDKKGSPLYYVTALAIKTPIPLLICLMGGILTLFTREERKPLNIYILFMAAAFIFVASRSSLQLGIRYILPALPLLIVIASIGVRRVMFSGIVMKILVGIMLIWFLAENVYIWPGYLSYFNEFVGGPDNGHKYLRDSNLDWGQDLPALKTYMDRNKLKEVGLYYFGGADPVFHGITYTPVTETELETPDNKVYAISVQYLDAVKWTKDLKPTGRAGYSILVYDMRK